MSGERFEIDFEEFNKITADEVEKKYVHNVYNNIANHFSDTRVKPWSSIKFFLESLSESSILVDVGCGNGKNMGISRGINYGCDICDNLLEIAKSKGHNVIKGDMLSLPYPDLFADVVINIAVLHHLSTEERRLKAIGEMLRILKINGLLMIYVWAKKEGQTNNDLFVGWTSKDQKTEYKRFYHFFEQKELENLCLMAGNCSIEKSYLDKENWGIILKKTS